MKKNLINVAVAATVAGVAATAHADMYVNPDKTGSVLLFPYYNAENGNQTSMHIVNTTDEAKAVKVRFMEYANSQEVLDFNLYLSAEDHFSFTIFQNPEGSGGAIVTADNSCTVPALGDDSAGIPGSTTENADGSITRIQPFLNYQYATESDTSLARGLKGHVEVIEMGQLNNAGTDATAWADFATHGADGVPANCAALVASWSTGGTWKGDVTSGIGAPTGGLYGLSNILNADDAAAFGVEPAAIEAFWGVGTAATVRHTDPGSTLPSLNNGDDTSLVANNGAYYANTFAGADAGVDAVSSLFMTKSVSNDVMTNADLNALTDWVITFPTRRFYVQGAARAPFTDAYISSGTGAGIASSCEPITINQWDREEAFVDQTQTPIFSPRPPNPTEEVNTLCYETNTLHAGAASALGANAVAIDFAYEDGWQRISFLDEDHELAATNANGAATVFEGLPAMGFAAVKFVNGSASYGFVSDHKTDTAGSAVGD